MPFFPRNRYYLRVSSSLVLPLYVYLDNQHVDWMSDRVLRQVVADLKPKITLKLRAESSAHLGPGPGPAGVMKGTVDVHRGDTYQFAYFLRETEPHSVLIKTRHFVLDTDPPPPSSSGLQEQQAGKRKVKSSRRKRHTTSVWGLKRRKAQGGRATGENSKDQDDYHPSDSDLFESDDLQADEDGDFEMGEDLSKGTTKGTRGVTDATTRVDVKKEEDEGRPQTKLITDPLAPHVGGTEPPIEVDEDDEPKPKLALELKYRAFSNFNRCLCVVVEPWPPQRSESRAPSLAPSTIISSSSITPTTSETSTSRDHRAKTPLFYPDFDDELTSPCHSHSRNLPPVPLFDDRPTSRETGGMEVWNDNTELMQFSQMLNATGRTGADVEEEDEFDGMALVADADEARGL